MIKLPEEVNKRIDGLGKKDGNLKALVYGLAIALVAVTSALMYLHVMSEKKGTKIEAIQAERIIILESQIRTKDSALVNCTVSRLKEAHENILREQELNDKKNQLIKRQDSLLNIK